MLVCSVSSEELNRDVFPVMALHNGEIQWLAPVIYRSSCLLDVSYFPWDSQICNLTFGSWTYDSSKLDLHNMTDEVVEQFTPNGEWTLKGVPVSRIVAYYECCTHPYITLDFSIIIERKPLYYIINLILPCVFITATAILVFYLPPNSGEKVSLAVTVLLASTVFLLLVAEAMPPQSEVVPLIG